MLGEPIFELVEQSRFIDAGRQLLGSDEVIVGACGMANSMDYMDDRKQVAWHSDGGPDRIQVAFRTALDRHDESNAPLRVLPGSHHRPKVEVKEELMNLELASGNYEEPPSNLYAQHPFEVEVVLDPHWTLVWSPSCWHATGQKTGAGPRRAIGWNFYVPEKTPRDANGAFRTKASRALKHIYDGIWQNWTPERKRLWALKD